MQPRILVVDDEPKIVELLTVYLEREGYLVDSAVDGIHALERFRHTVPNLVVLDLMLPRLDGWTVCREIRQSSKAGVIMLTAKVEDEDKLHGLDLGADDYITKPFSPREVVARVKAVLRRLDPEKENERIAVGNIVLDPERHEVSQGGRQIELTATEFKMLHVLLVNRGRVMSRLQLLDKVQGEAFEGYERTIDAHIKNLRQKIEKTPRRPELVITVHGVGYKFVDIENQEQK